jgi:hypothetical protein
MIRPTALPFNASTQFSVPAPTDFEPLRIHTSSFEAGALQLIAGQAGPALKDEKWFVDERVHTT